MQVNLVDQKNKQTTKKVELSDAVFAAKPNAALLAQYVYVFLSNQRGSIAHAKDRSEVSGGGRKPWKQKGTGRARVGSNRSPIWVGGGVTFGPTNMRNWSKTMPRKMRVAALKGAFSKLQKDGKLKVVESIELKEKQLTKQAAEMLKAFGSPRKLTIVGMGANASLMQAFRNLPSVDVVNVGELNAYTLLNAGEVLLLADTLEYINAWGEK